MVQLPDESVLQARRRKLGIILSIIIILAVIVPSFSLIFMRPPYPSEKTPISAISNGVRWTYDGNNYYGSNQRLYQVMIRDQANLVAAWSFYNYDANATGTHVIGIDSLGDLVITLTVTKVSSKAGFNAGDYFDLTLASAAAFPSDTAYTVSVYLSNGYYYISNQMIYGFAFHGGVLYSWRIGSNPIGI